VSKIPVTVSCDVAARASVVIEVEEKVVGTYSSVTERAKQHVLAALAIGADIPWAISTERVPAGLAAYKLDADEPPDFSEVEPAPSLEPIQVPQILEDEIPL
jgi:hypothetical protein